MQVIWLSMSMHSTQGSDDHSTASYQPESAAMIKESVVRSAALSWFILYLLTATCLANVEMEVGVSTEIDLGELLPAEQIDIAVVLINPDDQDFTLGQVVTSCGCTTIFDEPEMIPSGASAEMIIRFQSPRHSGSKTATVLFTQGGNGNTTWVLTLHGHVSVPIEIHPIEIDFGDVVISDTDAVHEIALEIVNSSEEGITILSSMATPECFTASLSSNVLDAGERINARISFSSPSSVGLIEGNVTFQTVNAG